MGIKIIIRLSLTLLFLVLLIPTGYFIMSDNTSTKNIKTNKHEPIKGKIQAYIINLDRSKERYAYIKNNVETLGYSITRFSAIDGNKLEQEILQQKVDLHKYNKFIGHYPRNGTIGCYLSHTAVWEEFLRSDAEFALILEDDVNFNSELLKQTIQEVIQMSNIWDIINFDIRHKGFPVAVRNLNNNQKLVYYLFEVTNAGCYLLNRKAAQTMLAKAYPMQLPIDHFFTRAWEFKLKFAGIEEPRLVQQQYGDSEINTSAKIQTNDDTRLTTKLFKIVYKIQSYIIRFFYNLILFIKMKYIY